MKRFAILLALTLVIALFPLTLASSSNNLALAAETIVINEVELNAPGTDSGAERLELYNPSDNPVDVGGWTISSTAGRGAIITIPEGMSIQAKDYVLVDRGAQWLDNEGEIIVLRDDSGDMVDTAGPFSDNDNDANTWQRSPDSADDWIFATETLGRPNANTSVPDSEASQPPANEQSQPSSSESTDPKPSEGATGQELKIVFIDVGQGDSILVILPNNNTLLIDGGERQSSDNILSTLQELGISEIDIVVATHPHADHIGGLIDVINNVDVGQVMDSGQFHTTQTFENLLDAIDAEQIPLSSVHAGDTVNLDPSVRLDVLNPPATLQEEGTDNEDEFNDNSVVIKLTYGGFTALFTGDMEEANEARLVAANKTALDADVLKAGHHGSRTSSTGAFLNAVTPEVVVISAGAGNTYGHPHPEALDRIEASDVQHVLRTDIDGTITLTTTGGSDYTIETTGSNKTVVVPEFGAMTIFIASISLISLVVYMNRGSIWKRSSKSA